MYVIKLFVAVIIIIIYIFNNKLYFIICVFEVELV